MIWLLAQDGGAGGGGGALSLPVMMALIAGLFYLMIMRPERQRQKERRARLASMKKNDRVVTVGGIYGVITNIQRDADEVTVKVDESTGAKLRLTIGSIDRVVSDESESEKSGK